MIGRRHSLRTAMSSVVVFVCILATTGCNTSRYSVTHDRRLPSIKKVAILPASVSVQSMHAGGVLEPRPDLIPSVTAQTVATATGEVKSHGREHIYVANDWEGPALDSVQPRLALLSTIVEAIKTHHYENGKARIIDYTTGDAISALVDDKETDAVLLVYLNAVVPTAGRKALAGTAMVVGVLTGIHVQVSTDQAFIALMLVHRETGEVLWYNNALGTADVESERQLRKLVEKACENLLEPYEK